MSTNFLSHIFLPFAPTEAAGRVEGSERSYPSTRTNVLHRDERFTIIIFFLLMPLPAYAIFEYDRAITEAQKGNWQESSAVLKNRIIQSPERADMLYDLGVSSYKNTEYDKALVYFDQAAQFSHNQIFKEQAFFNAGNTRVQLKQLQEAIDAYDNVLLLNPDHVKAKHNKEIVKKMMEQKKQDQEKKDQEKDKEDKQDKNQNQDQKKKNEEDKQNKQDQNDSDQKKQSKDQKDQQQNERDEQQDKKNQEEQKKQEKQNQEQEKKSGEEQKKESGSQHNQQESKQAENPEKGDAGNEKKLSPSLARILKEHEKKDADLNKKMIKAMAGTQKGGSNGNNCW